MLPHERIGIQPGAKSSFANCGGCFRRLRGRTRLRDPEMLPHLPIARLLTRFVGNRSGATAVVFALMALPVCGIMGAAIDYGMMMRAHTALQRGADAAAAAALPQIPMGADTVSQTIRSHFDANVPKAYQGLPLTHTTDDDPPFISIKVETKIEMTTLALLGYHSIEVNAEGLAQSAESKKALEIPENLGEPGRELSRNDTKLTPEALQDAQRKLAEFGIDLSPEQIQSLAEQAMREMQKGNLQ
jgi:hypothetical protein